ncbi:MAG: 8-oxo-dGTP pyrophosphatase MutT (NUDIX family), partial [Planctomycetota bacterium]
RDMVVLPNGKLQEYHVFEVGNAVAVVPILRNGHILLIGQYRYPHGKTHWEVPAGRLETDESAELAGVRELREETGHKAQELIELPGFYPTNGISAHYAHAYLALGCHEVSGLDLDPAERIIVRSFHPTEVEAMLREGLIEDAFAALTLLHTLHFYSQHLAS